MSLPIKGVMCIAAFSPSGIAKIEKNEQTRSPSVDFFCKIMKNSVLNSLIDAIMLSCFIFDMFSPALLCRVFLKCVQSYHVIGIRIQSVVGILVSF